MLQVIRNPKIHIISHPGDGTAELDFEPLVLAAKESHTLLAENRFPRRTYHELLAKKVLRVLGIAINSDGWMASYIEVPACNLQVGTSW